MLASTYVAARSQWVYSRVPVLMMHAYNLVGCGCCATGEALAQLCSASGDGLSRASLQTPALFDIFTRDKSGKSFEAQRLSVTLADMDTHRPVSVDVDMLETGRYRAIYTPLRTGVHELSIMLMQRHIAGSPFSVVVSTGQLSRLKSISANWSHSSALF